MIDARTFEIPIGINIFILCLGVVRLITDLPNWTDYVIGFFSISIPLLILYRITKGRAIGGGDIKLMASVGLVLGWQSTILSFILGCILGSLIHLIKMRIKDYDHQLAMGPYLSAGILISALFGTQFINWYLSLFI
jgi:leader peptidase (prepilin peptidase)/N-methyltransferase